MKRFILSTLKITLAVACFAALIKTSRLNLGLLNNLLNQPKLLITTGLLYFVGIILSASRWQGLNSAQNIHLGYRKTFLATYIGIAFNNLLPGSVSGDIYRSVLLFKNGKYPRSSILLSIFTDRLTGFLGVFVALSIAILFQINLIQQQSKIIYFIYVCIGLSVLSLFAFMLSSFLPNRLGLSSLISKKLAEGRVKTVLLSLLDGVRIYRNAKVTLVKCLLYSVGVQAFMALICLNISTLLGIGNISFVHLIIALSITQIVILVPITPGGFGIGEAAFAHALLLLNPGTNTAYATILVAYRVIGLFAYMPSIAVFATEHLATAPKKFNKAAQEAN